MIPIQEDQWERDSQREQAEITIIPHTEEDCMCIPENTYRRVCASLNVMSKTAYCGENRLD